jgi:uncharacterized phage protein (TIGR02220 family)
MRWVKIDNEAREKMGMSYEEYILCYYVHTLQGKKAKFCFATAETIANFLGVSRRKFFRIWEGLLKREIVEKANTGQGRKVIASIWEAAHSAKTARVENEEECTNGTQGCTDGTATVPKRHAGGARMAHICVDNKLSIDDSIYKHTSALEKNNTFEAKKKELRDRPSVAPDSLHAYNNNSIEVLEFLNSATDKNFRISEKNLQLASDALGVYSLGQIQKAIETKTAQVKGTKYEYILKPETLLKIENLDTYTNETVSIKRKFQLLAQQGTNEFGI